MHRHEILPAQSVIMIGSLTMALAFPGSGAANKATQSAYILFPCRKWPMKWLQHDPELCPFLILIVCITLVWPDRVSNNHIKIKRWKWVWSSKTWNQIKTVVNQIIFDQNQECFHGCSICNSRRSKN